jgi:hypothetical protein
MNKIADGSKSEDLCEGLELAINLVAHAREQAEEGGSFKIELTGTEGARNRKRPQAGNYHCQEQH